MAIVVHLNGRVCREEEALVSVLDHGFLYGDGVYEVLRTYRRQPFLFGRHLDRLRESARAIALGLGDRDADLEARVRETLEAFFRTPDNATVADAYLRLVLTRGPGEIGYDPALCPEPTLVIIAKPLCVPAAGVYERGVAVALVSVVRGHPDCVPLVKSNNLLNPILAAQEAFRLGAFDAVMRNARGELTECSIANLFIVKDGMVLTPPVDAGLLPGITRALVVELCDRLRLPAAERTLHDRDLFGADECFRTNSTQAIVPIVRADHRAIGSGRPGPVTRRLADAYQAMVDASMPSATACSSAGSEARGRFTVGA